MICLGCYIKKMRGEDEALCLKCISDTSLTVQDKINIAVSKLRTVDGQEKKP